MQFSLSLWTVKYKKDSICHFTNVLVSNQPLCQNFWEAPIYINPPSPECHFWAHLQNDCGGLQEFKYKPSIQRHVKILTRVKSMEKKPSELKDFCTEVKSLEYILLKTLPNIHCFYPRSNNKPLPQILCILAAIKSMQKRIMTLERFIRAKNQVFPS